MSPPAIACAAIIFRYAGRARRSFDRSALVVPEGVGVGAPPVPLLLATPLAIIPARVPLRRRAPGIASPLLVGVGAPVAGASSGVIALCPGGACLAFALAVGVLA